MKRTAYGLAGQHSSYGESERWSQNGTDNFGVDFTTILSDYKQVKVAAVKKEKSEADLLDQATGQLLRAVRQKMRKKQGGVDYAKLRKEGYSDRFLARLEDA